MKDLNDITILGNTGQDAEVKQFEDGNMLVRLSVATNRNYKDRNGQWQTLTQWHAIIVRGPATERAAQMTKGTRVLVKGELTYRTFEKDGSKRKVAEIVVGGPGHFVADQTPREQSQGNGPGPSTGATTQASTGGAWEDDIPF